MKQLTQEIIRTLTELFEKPTTLEEKISVLERIIPYIHKLDNKEQKRLYLYLKENEKAVSRNHSLLLKSYVFFLTRDEESLKSMGRELFKYTDSLPEYHYLAWKLLISMFQFYGDLKPQAVRWVREHCIRPSYNQLLGNIEQCVDSTLTYTRRGEIKKIAFVVGQLLGPLHSPSRNAYIQASGLIRQHHLDVHIINTNLLPIHRELEYFGCSPVNYNKALTGKQCIYYEDAEFGRNKLTVFSQPPGPIDLNSVVNLWNYIEEEQFDAIINLGDVLFAADYFKGKIPILCISTSTHLPLSSADQYLLIKDSIDQEERALCHKLGMKEPALSWSLNVSPEKKQSDISRETFGIPADAFVYVVVGNRLCQEINSEFLDICQKILKVSDKNHLCFVGTHTDLSSMLHSLDFNQSGRVHNIPFQDDLRSFYSICNVYLNPFRSGGGVSAQIAILEKMAVVTLSKGDVSVCLRPEQCCKTILDYENLALSLSTDVSIYETWRQAMEEHANSLQSNKASIERLYNLLLSIEQDYKDAAVDRESLTVPFTS